MSNYFFRVLEGVVAGVTLNLIPSMGPLTDAARRAMALRESGEYVAAAHCYDRFVNRRDPRMRTIALGHRGECYLQQAVTIWEHAPSQEVAMFVVLAERDLRAATRIAAEHEFPIEGIHSALAVATVLQLSDDPRGEAGYLRVALEFDSSVKEGGPLETHELERLRPALQQARTRLAELEHAQLES